MAGVGRTVADIVRTGVNEEEMVVVVAAVERKVDTGFKRRTEGGRALLSQQSARICLTLPSFRQ